LLDALRFDESRGAPAGAALRVRQRLERTITGFPADDERRSQSSQVAPGKAARRRTAWARSAAISLAALFLAGGVGAAIHAALAPRVRATANDEEPAPAMTQHHATKSSRRATVAVLPTEAIATAQPVATAEATAADLVATAEPVAPPAKPGPRTAPAIDDKPLIVEAPAPSSGLIAERALLDRARAAFGAGRYADAEQALERHARGFPSAELAEEREALAVRTLAAHGQIPAARERAARFHERFPHSLFASAGDSAVRAIP
jgi:TolA-binding protein